MEQIKISGLNFTYPGSEEKTLADIDLSVREGEFLLIFGRSGCGKTTFLKQLKPVLAPFGKRSGTILFQGREIGVLSEREQSGKIGYVSQDPENQIVTDKVWHELAFGLESLGIDSGTIRIRVAEMASFFGIQSWFFRPVEDLSEGQKQILNLASVMVMQPEVLLLDEPTSQLDPVAASRFIQMLRKINEDLGVTVLISEHRLEEVLPVCTRVLYMEKGRIAADTDPGGIGEAMKKLRSGMSVALPACVRICAEFENGKTPVTVRGARLWLKRRAGSGVRTLSGKTGPGTGRPKPKTESPAAALSDIWFRYDRKSEDVLRGVSLKIRRGAITSILGGNGVGKSTLLSVLGGLLRPYRGKVEILGRNLGQIVRGERYRGLLGCLPQDPRRLFRRSTVRQDLEDMASEVCRSGTAAEAALSRVIRFFCLGPLLDRHPFDLSGGELECAALAKVLLTQPEILLLDEPTKGIDAVFKQKLAGLFSALKREGKTIVLVSHDLDFCAACSDDSALMFGGEILSENSTRNFFIGNSFYTTSANRIARGIFPEALTSEEVIRACRENPAGD